jgi:hypothetical protein
MWSVAHSPCIFRHGLVVPSWYMGWTMLHGLSLLTHSTSCKKNRASPVRLPNTGHRDLRLHGDAFTPQMRLKWNRPMQPTIHYDCPANTQETVQMNSAAASMFIKLPVSSLRTSVPVCSRRASSSTLVVVLSRIVPSPVLILLSPCSGFSIC